MKTINEHLKKKSFKNVYLLYGSEAYLRNQYRDRLLDALVMEGDSMNYTVYEGKDIDGKQIMAMADTVPFFADYRVILVENSGFFKKETIDELLDGGEIRKSVSDEFIEYVKHVPESTCIIFVEADIDRRNRLYKAIVSAGYAAVFDRPNQKQLILWLASMVKKAGKQVHEQTLLYFMELVENDMNNMSIEMEKLICYVGDRPAIMREDVDAVCCVFVENKIFDLITAIAARDRAKAMKLYENLMILKEEPFRILALIIRQFRTIYEIKDLVIKGYPASVIADRLGQKEFIIKKNAKLGQSFELDQLREIIDYGLELEHNFKSGILSDMNKMIELMLIRCLS